MVKKKKQRQPKWLPAPQRFAYAAWSIKIGPVEVTVRRTPVSPTIWEAQSTGRSADVFEAPDLVTAQRRAVAFALRRVEQERRALSTQYEALIDYEVMH